MLIGVGLAAMTAGQLAQAQASQPTFEVASVKVATPGIAYPP